jgi:ATP-dependent DNA ligase
MTKKHFEALAQAFRNAKSRTRKHGEYSNIRMLCYDIIEICEQANPNFDRDKFLEVVNTPLPKSNEVPKRMQEKLTIPAE